MYRHSQKMHRGAQKRKNSWKAKQPTPSTNSGERETVTDGSHEVDTHPSRSLRARIRPSPKPTLSIDTIGSTSRCRSWAHNVAL